MSDSVTLPGTGASIETLDTSAGANKGQRQVITIAPRDLSGVDSIGSLTETAPASDTASSGVNGRLQRVAQRLTTLITALGSPFQAGGSIGNTEFGISGTLPAFAATPTVNVGESVLPNGAATEATLASALAKISADPATQTTLAALVSANHTDLAAILAKLSADPATQTTLAAVLAKLTADPATQTTLAAILTKLSASIAVTGTFFQATQPVSVTALPLPVGAGTAANQAAPNTASVTNPTSTLTLPATTTAYLPLQLIANNATAGSVAVPSFAIANSAGGAKIPRLRLTSNDATSTGWAGQSVQIDLWSAAPTFTNGDRGTYAVATGSAKYLGSFSGTFSAVAGDGVYAILEPTAGDALYLKLATGTSVFWTMQSLTGSGVTGASKVWTLTPEVVN